jgi:hypothetical protein
LFPGVLASYPSSRDKKCFLEALEKMDAGDAFVYLRLGVLVLKQAGDGKILQ